jgi:hypothetical protein
LPALELAPDQHGRTLVEHQGKIDQVQGNP